MRDWFDIALIAVATLALIAVVTTGPFGRIDLVHAGGVAWGMRHLNPLAITIASAAIDNAGQKLDRRVSRCFCQRVIGSGG